MVWQIKWVVKRSNFDFSPLTPCGRVMCLQHFCAVLLHVLFTFELRQGNTLHETNGFMILMALAGYSSLHLLFKDGWSLFNTAMSDRGDPMKDTMGR